MANGIKYSASAQTQALKKGDFWIATGDIGKGSDYYSEIPPPTGGYTIYLNKASGGPSIFTASSDAQLIYWTKQISGNTYGTVAECLNWFAGQSDKMVFNKSYPAIITDQLVLSLDSSFTSSYPRTGTTWYNMSGASNSTLVNGAVFDSSSGGIRFDGADDYVNTSVLTNSIFSSNDPFSVSIFVNPTATISVTSGLVCNQKYQSEPSPGGFGIVTYSSNQVGVNMTKNDGTGIQSYQQIAPTTLSINSWQNITYTYDPVAGTVRAYKNGSLVNAGTSASYKWTPEARATWVGANTQGGWETRFTGQILNVCIYKKTLSASDILQNYYSVLNAGMIVPGSILNLQAGNPSSYPGSGTLWKDVSGNGYNGTLTNGPTYNSSDGGSIQFDGTDDYVLWSNNPLSSLTSAKTYEVWVKFTQSQNTFTISCGTLMVYLQAGSTWYVNQSGASNSYVPWTFSTGWTHFVYSFNGTNHLCYINGVSYNITFGSGLSSQTNLYIGNRVQLDSPLKGNIAVTRVYNRGLSASEMLQNYNVQKSRFGL
jgi:hypothetical protein